MGRRANTGFGGRSAPRREPFPIAGQGRCRYTGVLYRPTKRPLHRPFWLDRIVARLGMPVLGIVLAVIAGWLVTHL